MQWSPWRETCRCTPTLMRLSAIADTDYDVGER